MAKELMVPVCGQGGDDIPALTSILSNSNPSLYLSCFLSHSRSHSIPLSLTHLVSLYLAFSLAVSFSRCLVHSFSRRLTRNGLGTHFPDNKWRGQEIIPPCPSPIANLIEEEAPAPYQLEVHFKSNRYQM